MDAAYYGGSESAPRGESREPSRHSLEPIELRGSRLPPYGREVERAIAQGKPVNVFVYAGHGAWDRARAHHERRGLASTMVSPPGEDPAIYRWPRVDGGLLVIARKRIDAFNVARAIASYGTPLVTALFGDGEGLFVKSSTWRNPLSEAA